MDILRAEDVASLVSHNIYQISYRDYKDWESRVVHWGDTAALIVSATFVSSGGDMHAMLAEWLTSDLSE